MSRLIHARDVNKKSKWNKNPIQTTKSRKAAVTMMILMVMLSPLAVQNCELLIYPLDFQFRYFAHFVDNNFSYNLK